MTPINILIVEDEAILSMDLAYRLTQMGYQVIGSADNGLRALAIFQENSVDLVLLDIHIAGEWDGIETARQMCRIKQIPLIFLTAMTDGATIEQARAVAPSAYMTKPFNDLSLRIAIDLAIHNFTVQQAAQQIAAINGGHQATALIETSRSQSVAPVDPTEMAKGELILFFGEHVFIKQNYRFIKFRLADVLYLRSDGNYTDILTPTHKYTLRLVLNKVLEKLQASDASQTGIVRVHRSFAVNLRQIDSFSDNEVFIRQHTIPVGRSYRDQFIKSFELM